MSHGSVHTAQLFFFFLHHLSESVLSLLRVFSCGVPFIGTSFLGVSFSDFFVSFSPPSFPCLEECFPLLAGLLILGLISSAPVGGFFVAVSTLWWGLTVEPVGGSTSGDFSRDFIFFFFLGLSLLLPAVVSLEGPAASSPTFLGPMDFSFSPLQCLK